MIFLFLIVLVFLSFCSNSKVIQNEDSIRKVNMRRGVRDSRFDDAAGSAGLQHNNAKLAALELLVAQELWHVGRLRSPSSAVEFLILQDTRSAYFTSRSALLTCARSVLLMELHRQDAFAKLSEEIKDLFVCSVKGLQLGILSAHDAHELPCRWVVQHSAEMPVFMQQRSHVTVRDVGRDVRIVSSCECGTVCEVSSMNAGEYWVRVAVCGNLPNGASKPAGELAEEMEMNTARADGGEDGTAAACSRVGSFASSLLSSPASQAPDERRIVTVEREDAVLLTPEPLFPDPLVPCDDGTPRGTSGCIALAATLGLNKLCGVGGDSTAVAANLNAQERASETDRISLEVADAARRHRIVLCEKFEKLVAEERKDSLLRQPLGAELLFSDRSDAVVVRIQRGDSRLHVDLFLLQRSILKLAHLYRHWESEEFLFASDRSSILRTAAADEGFVARLSAMLLRYDSLLGGHGRNQGPQAAVPPTVLRAIREHFGVDGECFASPLNAQIGTFCSMFPDVDAPFGSIGSFFDVDFRKGSFEVNPPFDTKLLWALHNRLDALLAAAAERCDALLFFIICPCHLQPLLGGGRKRGRPGDSSAEDQRSQKTPLGAMLASRFCAGALVCDARRTCFVDGHQHGLRNPYFTITTDTQLLVLASPVSCSAMSDVSSRLQMVRDAWHAITEV